MEEAAASSAADTVAWGWNWRPNISNNAAAARQQTSPFFRTTMMMVYCCCLPLRDKYETVMVIVRLFICAKQKKKEDGEEREEGKNQGQAVSLTFSSLSEISLSPLTVGSTYPAGRRVILTDIRTAILII